jgi:hypothetical protein
MSMETKDDGFHSLGKRPSLDMAAEGPTLLQREVVFEKPLKHYYKQILTSLWLLLMGTTLLGAGFVLLFTNERKSHWLGCFVLGSILFIPGAYHSRIVYLSVRKKQGYSFSHMAHF